MSISSAPRLTSTSSSLAFAIAGASSAAFARDEPEIEAADARGGAVQHIEAVPPILHHAERQRRLGGERENGFAIRPRESAGAKNEHRFGLVGRRMVGESGERFGPAPR